MRPKSSKTNHSNLHVNNKTKIWQQQSGAEGRKVYKQTNENEKKKKEECLPVCFFLAFCRVYSRALTLIVVGAYLRDGRSAAHRSSTNLLILDCRELEIVDVDGSLSRASVEPRDHVDFCVAWQYLNKIVHKLAASRLHLFRVGDHIARVELLPNAVLTNVNLRVAFLQKQRRLRTLKLRARFARASCSPKLHNQNEVAPAR